MEVFFFLYIYNYFSFTLSGEIRRFCRLRFLNAWREDFNKKKKYFTSEDQYLKALQSFSFGIPEVDFIAVRCGTDGTSIRPAGPQNATPSKNQCAEQSDMVREHLC